jgi:hypothetical protein
VDRHTLQWSSKAGHPATSIVLQWRTVVYLLEIESEMSQDQWFLFS